MTQGRTLVLATVTSVRDTSWSYPFCTICYSKILYDHADKRWWCMKCRQDYTKQDVSYRYRLCLSITDALDQCDVTIFGTCLDKFFGLRADELERYIKSVEERLHCLEAISVDQLVKDSMRAAFVGNLYLFGFRSPAANKCMTSQSYKSPVRLRNVMDYGDFKHALDTQLGQHKKDLVAYQMAYSHAGQSTVTVYDVLKLNFEQLIRTHDKNISDSSSFLGDECITLNSGSQSNVYARDKQTDSVLNHIYTPNVRNISSIFCKSSGRPSSSQRLSNVGGTFQTPHASGSVSQSRNMCYEPSYGQLSILLSCDRSTLGANYNSKHSNLFHDLTNISEALIPTKQKSVLVRNEHSVDDRTQNVVESKNVFIIPTKLSTQTRSKAEIGLTGFKSNNNVGEHFQVLSSTLQNKSTGVDDFLSKKIENAVSQSSARYKENVLNSQSIMSQDSASQNELPAKECMALCSDIHEKFHKFDSVENIGNLVAEGSQKSTPSKINVQIINTVTASASSVKKHSDSSCGKIVESFENSFKSNSFNSEKTQEPDALPRNSTLSENGKIFIKQGNKTVASLDMSDNDSLLLFACQNASKHDTENGSNKVEYTSSRIIAKSPDASLTSGTNESKAVSEVDMPESEDLDAFLANMDLEGSQFQHYSIDHKDSVGNSKTHEKLESHTSSDFEEKSKIRNMVTDTVGRSIQLNVTDGALAQPGVPKSTKTLQNSGISGSWSNQSGYLLKNLVDMPDSEDLDEFLANMDLEGPLCDHFEHIHKVSSLTKAVQTVETKKTDLCSISPGYRNLTTPPKTEQRNVNTTAADLQLQVHKDTEKQTDHQGYKKDYHDYSHMVCGGTCTTESVLEKKQLTSQLLETTQSIARIPEQGDLLVSIDESGLEEPLEESQPVSENKWVRKCRLDLVGYSGRKRSMHRKVIRWRPPDQLDESDTFDISQEILQLKDNKHQHKNDDGLIGHLNRVDGNVPAKQDTSYRLTNTVHQTDGTENISVIDNSCALFSDSDCDSESNFSGIPHRYNDVHLHHSSAAKNDGIGASEHSEHSLLHKSYSRLEFGESMELFESSIASGMLDRSTKSQQVCNRQASVNSSCRTFESLSLSLDHKLNTNVKSATDQGKCPEVLQTSFSRRKSVHFALNVSTSESVSTIDEQMKMSFQTPVVSKRRKSCMKQVLVCQSPAVQHSEDSTDRTDLSQDLFSPHVSPIHTENCYPRSKDAQSLPKIQFQSTPCSNHAEHTRKQLKKQGLVAVNNVNDTFESDVENCSFILAQTPACVRQSNSARTKDWDMRHKKQSSAAQGNDDSDKENDGIPVSQHKKSWFGSLGANISPLKKSLNENLETGFKASQKNQSNSLFQNGKNCDVKSQDSEDLDEVSATDSFLAGRSYSLFSDTSTCMP